RHRPRGTGTIARHREPITPMLGNVLPVGNAYRRNHPLANQPPGVLTMSKLLRFSPLVALLGVAACVTMPTGPSVTAMPGTGKSFDQFRADDADCRQYALSQIGGATANDAAVDSAVK